MDKDLVQIYNGILLSHKTEWSFARCTTQMDLEGFRLSDIKSDGERHTVWYNWYVGSEKYNELVNKKKKQEIHM